MTDLTDRQRELVAQFRALAEEVGHTPTMTDMTPGFRTQVARQLGSSTNCARLAGLTPNRQGCPAMPLPAREDAPGTPTAPGPPEDTGIDLEAERAASLKRTEAKKREGMAAIERWEQGDPRRRRGRKRHIGGDRSDEFREPLDLSRDDPWWREAG